jgi:hypothetical protein
MPGRYEFSLPQRRSRDGWFRIGQLDITTTTLLVILGIASMFVYAIDGSGGAFSKLPYVAPWVRSGDVWRVFTWPIANPPDRIWVILTLAFFWFVGHRVEDIVGRVRFTVMVAAMTVVPAALVSLFNFTAATGLAYGLGIPAIALLVVFAFDSPNATWWFGIPLWIIACVFVLLDVLQQLGIRMFGALLVELGAILVGLVMGRQFGMLDDLPFIPRLVGQASKPAKRPRTASSSGSNVLAGPWGADPMQAIADQMELDRLLDKISGSGIDSLSNAEKSRLNELSKKLRGR